jgi:predicted DNA-binding transcriptional regulator AlpA
MSIEHSPAKQRRRIRHQHDEPFSLEDQKVLTIKQWAALNGISMPTAVRRIREGDGPPTVQLSKRRIGIRVGDNRRWQEARLRP